MIPMPSLRPVFDTLRAIEERAAKAIVQELDLMIQTVLDLRPQTDLESRAYADALLLKLDDLRCRQLTQQPACAEKDAFYPKHLQIDPIAPPLSGRQIDQARHSVHLYASDSGFLNDIVITHGFMAAVEVFHERVSAVVDCLVEATWSHGQMVRGRLTARTMQGIVVAVIQPDGHCSAQDQHKANDQGTLTQITCESIAQAA